MKKVLQSIFSVKNDDRKSHKIVTIFGLKFKFRIQEEENFSSINTGYDISGTNNKIMIIEEDGTERELKYNEKIDGLHIVMAGKDNLVKIHKPYKFINCNFNINSTKAYFEILDNNIWGICNLNVRCMFGENQILKIGRNTTFSGGYINLDEDSGLIIGDDCMFGGYLSFFPSDGHSVIDLDKKSILNKVVAPIIIGDHVWIGEHSIILKNAHIKSNSIVAAGSVVTKSFDFENVIIAGNPAKIIKHNCTWDRTSPMYLNKVLKEKTNA
ncbi:acyltransferase [bacterium]|nr:acyltransferase [bacterium]